MRKISKKVLAVILALICLFTLVTPAFGAVNVDGNGGKRESPINVKFVWLASIKKGSTTYL